MSFSEGKDGYFTFYVETEKNDPARTLTQNTSFEAVYLLWGRHILKSLFFVKWRALKSLPPSTKQENSCWLASASCEQLHRQTLSLQLSSSILIFTLANPYTKQNSFNCRWWAWERANPSISGSQVLVWDLPHRWAIWIFLLHMFNNYYGLLGFSEIQLPASD